MSTWWIGKEQLDEDQLAVIGLPLEKDVLITGPPGSGKTNLLLLRANYLYLAKKRNIVISTFTRPLREFIASGAEKYAFPAAKIMTSLEWQTDLIRQYRNNFSTSGDFQTKRLETFRALEEITKDYNLKNVFDAILLDEAQDYSVDEFNLIKILAAQVFCVADGRQQIYQSDDVIKVIKENVDDEINLRYHYRNGPKICRAADKIAKKWPGFELLAQTSNYPDSLNPATVKFENFLSLEQQMESMISRISAQLAAFPGESIGILVPKRGTLETIWNFMENSEFAGMAVLLHSSGENNTLSSETPIVVTTCHSAKGLEFRCGHILNIQELKKFENNRRMAFTSITRVKTSLVVYSDGNEHPYIEAALLQEEGIVEQPKIEDAFGPNS